MINKINNRKTPPATAEHPSTTSYPDKTGGTGEGTPTNPTILRGPRGRFLKGTLANPAGRPPRSTSQATLFARAILEEAAPELAQLAIAEAKRGNPIALKLCLDRLIPQAQDRTVRIPMPAPDPTPDGIFAAHAAVLHAVTEGDITPHEGQSLSSIVEAQRRAWETTVLADRLTNLEDRIDDFASAPKTPRIRWANDDDDGSADDISNDGRREVDSSDEDGSEVDSSDEDGSDDDRSPK